MTNVMVFLTYERIILLADALFHIRRSVWLFRAMLYLSIFFKHLH